MSLVEVRERFIVEYSGRYDLVVDTVDFADNGADKYIRAGQKWLDRTFEIAKIESSWYESLLAGRWYTIVPLCRVVESVYMSNTEHERWRLTYVDFSTFRCENPGDVGAGTPGRTSVYTTTSVRTIPEVSNTITIDKFASTAYTTAGDHFGYIGLLFSVPTDQATQLEVHGKFYQPVLTEDDDVNYWTEEEPEALAKAAAMQLEMSLRNHQGVADWEAAIRTSLLGLEFDFADQQSAEIRQMEG